MFKDCSLLRRTIKVEHRALIQQESEPEKQDATVQAIVKLFYYLRFSFSLFNTSCPSIPSSKSSSTSHDLFFPASQGPLSATRPVLSRCYWQYKLFHIILKYCYRHEPLSQHPLDTPTYTANCFKHEDYGPWSSTTQFEVNITKNGRKAIVLSQLDHRYGAFAAARDRKAPANTRTLASQAVTEPKSEEVITDNEELLGCRRIKDSGTLGLGDPTKNAASEAGDDENVEE
ncbi:hypothetical protein HOY80DRAFT_1042828 [Tuber brumale]|nr:hypothetical protein HOY80DRAFT_1042828 [Tuber brumale]